MPCRIPEIKRRTIEVNIALEKPAKEIAKDVNVSRRSVQRFSQNLRVYGSIVPPKVIPQGRPRTITSEMQEVRIILSLLATFCLYKKLTARHFWITFLRVLLYTLMSRFTIYGIHSIFKSMSNALSACSNV